MGGGVVGVGAVVAVGGGVVGAGTAVAVAGGVVGAGTPVAVAGGVVGAGAPVAVAGGVVGAGAPVAVAGGVVGVGALVGVAGGVVGGGTVGVAVGTTWTSAGGDVGSGDGASGSVVPQADRPTIPAASPNTEMRLNMAPRSICSSQFTDIRCLLSAIGFRA